jgi:hypothetical protein
VLLAAFLAQQAVHSSVGLCLSSMFSIFEILFAFNTPPREKINKKMIENKAKHCLSRTAVAKTY